MKELSQTLLVLLTIVSLYVFYVNVPLSRTIFWPLQFIVPIVTLILVGLNFENLSNSIHNFLNKFKDEA